MDDQTLGDLKRAAEAGDREAQYTLGDDYRKKSDYVEALRWLHKSASQSDPQAMYDIALMYHRGTGVKRDMQVAADWFRRASEEGYAPAAFNLALMYQRGDGIDRDPERAVTLYRKSGELGDSHAYFNLGAMYANGDGVTQNMSEALRWYMKAARAGHAMAESAAALFYLEGIGVQKDYSRAFTLYAAAAAQGEPLAQGALGYLYWRGLCVTRDDVKAYVWFSLAAAQNNAAGIRGCREIRSGLTKVDLARADALLREWTPDTPAVPDAHSENYFYVGNKATRPAGAAPAQSDEEARMLASLDEMKQRANGGEVQAQMQLGLIYHQGHTSIRNLGEAVKWYEKAARQGNSTSQVALALIFATEAGHIDLVASYMWAHLACVAGIEAARMLKRDLERTLSDAEMRVALDRAASAG